MAAQQTDAQPAGVAMATASKRYPGKQRASPALSRRSGGAARRSPKSGFKPRWPSSPPGLAGFGTSYGVASVRTDASKLKQKAEDKIRTAGPGAGMARAGSGWDWLGLAG
eukprot:CAMPEP_0204464798 /NCGR_PEP_ID=MMETSP0471-20130131/7910_1 /ASSEMBLY_ACC=CAM_ASM_000602 /TAXON_ID=2969 /ORGANISM="Oxyrrhis marina" /LENGTH=109 /DNA_ID=CAMNT_0051466269 /DNA_START=29 /DNA_END=355 /DNA_ORIENTATION=+